MFIENTNLSLNRASFSTNSIEITNVDYLLQEGFEIDSIIPTKFGTKSTSDAYGKSLISTTGITSTIGGVSPISLAENGGSSTVDLQVILTLASGFTGRNMWDKEAVGGETIKQLWFG